MTTLSVRSRARRARILGAFLGSCLLGVGAAAPPGEDKYEGFGAACVGGDGKPQVAITALTDAAVRSAFSKAASTGSVQVVFQVKGDVAISSGLPVLTKPYVTVEGNGGATIWADKIGGYGKAIEATANDIVLRNFRVRNGGDNMSFKAPAQRIIVSHVSSTGSYDDGLSFAYGSKDGSVQWCFFGGNTRSTFIKYGGATNVSYHHNLLEKQWIRGPLIYGALVDLRNTVVRNWSMWGSRFESGGTGNAVNNLRVLEPFAGGKPDSAIYVYGGAGKCYFSGNVGRGCTIGAGNSSTPIAVPAVVTDSVADTETWVMARAGCSPRDSLDALYVKITSYTRPGDGRPLRLAAPANKPPTAKGAVSVTTGRTISFDGSGSTDADGTVAKWYWNFGDGRTWVSAKGGTHTYAANGTYWVTLLAEDSYGAQGRHQVPVTVGGTTAPGALSVSPATGLASSGPPGGPFAPSGASWALTNTGGASLNWTASKAQSWLTLSAASGSLAAGASATVTASVNSGANALAAGSYSDTVTIANTTNGAGNTTRPVALVVSTIPPPPPPPPPSGMFAKHVFIGLYEGTTKAYENTGTSSPVWTARTAWDLPDVGSDTAPAIADLDADGKPDLLLGERNGISFGYKNNGAGWTRTTAWDTPDIGYGAVPALGDLDGDGDLDILVGANDGITRAFKNTGSASAPVWSRNTGWDIADVGGYSKPVLADLDDDGDLDLFIGESYGKCFGYKNTGSASAPVWARNTAWDTVDIGTQAGPALKDLDGDGDLDLVVGNNAGNGVTLKNTGTLSAPAWTAEPAWNLPDLGTNSRPGFLTLP